MDNVYIRLSERLGNLCKQIEAHGNYVLINQIIGAIGEKSFGVLLLIFSILSAIPVPLPGYNTLCGIAITLLLIQMLYGKEIPWIPERVKGTKLPKEMAIKGLNKTIGVLKAIEHLIYPRMSIICHNRVFYTLLLVLGILTMIPIPFVTAIPALALILCALGLVEGDGFVCLVGSLIGFIIIIGYGVFIYYFIFYGMNGIAVWLGG